MPDVTAQGFVELVIPWVPQLNLNLTFYLDGLGLIFVLIVTGIGAAITLYAGYYFDTEAEMNRFYRLLFAFSGAMLLLVLSGNLLLLFVAWELTSIISFMLIGFKGAKEADARFGALQALMITGGGGLALLAGVILLGTAAGSFELSSILANETLTEHPWYLAFTSLILVGCFTKSAQFPFHFWLPGAMSAPSPASAFLHSATMVKAGIYLAARLYPALANTPFWTDTLTFFGIATVVVGAVLALRQRDLKGLLAYSTISMLGTFIALIGQPESEGLKAAYVGILAHALYKATLFLVAGAIDHAAHTRIIDKLGGLARQMPGWAVIATICGLSMAGIPPLFGYVGKEVYLEAMLHHPQQLVVMSLVIAGAALTTTVALIFIWDVFFKRPAAPVDVHLPERGLGVGPGMLA
ncbi:MAG: hypothetical protein GYB67_06510, partial [Chloroflexi bacterium]|nr:hypothetical protein [Chloroflexota bacterium]